ncbi:MAG: phytanoyl-CoA dioxygenase family protein [Chitinophagaceae bacterium]|nr:phytanoyl-CoA dioxygenase family protein [Chitinophagaceae bacterium]
MSTLQLPALDTLIKIGQSQINEFRKNGHILTRNVLNGDEVECYRSVINTAAYKYNTEKRALEERDTYGKAFLQVMNLWEVDEYMKKFTMARRFAKIAADLLGVEHVRIYHDQALYKEPGGGLTPWHQDQYYWPLDTIKTITMWMPMIDIDEQMGMLTFASGSHTSGFVENIAISDESEKKLEHHIKKKGFSITRPQLMNAGDATWHYGWTLHSAPGNSSIDTTREVMTIIYFADGAHVTKPENEHQEADRQRWLCGLEPGSLAVSPLNPLVL